MDLVTFVAACSLAVNAKLMHALIWHQSGGEPWSFSVPAERQPQVYRSAREAVREAHTEPTGAVPISLGLTGLTVGAGSVTSAMFMPYPNISIAAGQITQLTERCKAAPRFAADPIHCAIAAYGGSWKPSRQQVCGCRVDISGDRRRTKFRHAGRDRRPVE
jgi:hypothetical protein